MKILHNVKITETIDDIAKIYGVSASKIKELNNLCDNEILPKVIEIPISYNEFCVVKNFKRTFLYIVQDNFKQVKINMLKNGFKTNIISANNYDKVLFKPIDNDIYVVKPTENLKLICNRFNLDENKIMQINNLKDGKLFIGQILKLN